MYRSKNNNCDHESDCERIRNLAASFNIVMSINEAEEVWDKYSDMYAASWLHLPESDEELWSCIEDIIAKMLDNQ